MTYFSILGLTPSMQLDAVELKTAYFAKQKQFHPDKAANDAERLAFIQQSADINAAYHTLKDDAQRLYYLLTLHGADILKEAGASVPPTILMQSMQWREELEECADEAQRAAFGQSMQQEREKALAKAQQALRDNNIDAAVEAATGLRYIEKIIQEAS